MGARSLYKLSVAVLAASPAVSHAHYDFLDSSAVWPWHVEPWLAFLIVASAFLYARGVVALWRKAGLGRGIRTVEVTRFGLGFLALAAALLSPLDVLAGRSFAAHMAQHELLMVVAAPLFVLARPLEVWAWALPTRIRSAFVAVARARLARFGWRWLTVPIVAWSLHAVALWIWHVPALFLAALDSASLHVLQHTCFFASALLFWWMVFGSRAHRPAASSVASLFTTMLHTSALGALLSLAPTPWYTRYAGPGLFGLTALEDQQLGGLLMWVPGSLCYLMAVLLIVASWLSPPRMRQGRVSS